MEIRASAAIRQNHNWTAVRNISGAFDNEITGTGNRHVRRGGGFFLQKKEVSENGGKDQ